MNNLTKKIGIGLIFLAILAGSFLSGIYIGFENRPAFQKLTNIVNKGSSENASGTDFAPFWKAWEIINEKYPESEKITDQERVYGAIKGLLGSLKDPYSVFFNPEENKAFNEEISGEFSGIGVELSEKNHILTVISPLKGTPADRAGLTSGDQIIKIGKQYTSEISIDEAMKLIRGPEGTQVELTILREGLSQPKVLTITREKITVPSLETEVLEKEGIFVIKLYSFSAKSANEFNDAVREFSKTGYNKLILDLRNNPGGYLESAVSMAGWFLPDGSVVVKEVGKKETNIKYHRSRGPGVFKDKIKMAILVNGGSASASEILSGALQENGVAKLVGKKTFGKGSVQELVKLTKDTSIKITIAKWYTPKGISISENGLKPDIEVDQKTGANEKVDEQLERAIKELNK